VVQPVLSAQVDTSEKLQRHNLFHIFFVVKDCRVRTIIDGGNCNNLVSADFVVKIGLMTRLHTHPYYIQWLNNGGKARVTHTTRVHLSIGTYYDYGDCDVVPMQACSLLLGHPWEFDTDAIHHGRSNKYTLVHNRKKITLLPLTPNEIV
jgi:hypothetical protein